MPESVVEGKYEVYFDVGSTGLMSQTVNAKNAKEAAKTLSANVFVRINPNTHFNKSTGGPYPLGVTDGFKIRKIYIFIIFFFNFNQFIF